MLVDQFLFFTYRAVLKKYLLEKSRIVSQGPDERNYHVFYYMLAGANNSEKEQLCLKTPQEYHYLNQVGKINAHENFKNSHVFWTPGLPEGVLSNRPSPCVCVSMCVSVRL